MFSVQHREKGQGLAEYALILALIALVVVGAVAVFGTTVNGMFEDITTHFASL